MIKKYLLYILLLPVVIMFSACSDWLDINSERDVYQEELFTKAEGYFSVVNGMYQSMASLSMYGENLTWGAMEAWGKGYEFTGSSNLKLQYLLNLEYERSYVRSIGESIWEKSYKIIAEANNLLQHIEKDNTTKFPGGEAMKNLVKGEALAIRALMHFEIARIFAKAPIDDNGGVSAMIPYVNTFPSKVNPSISTKEVFNKVIEDLERAKDLIQPIDTSEDYHGLKDEYHLSHRLLLDRDWYAGMPSEEFILWRCNRLNYYAVLHLLSRVSLYAGDNEKAYYYANKFIELNDEEEIFSFTSTYYMGNPDENKYVNPRLQNEVVFGLYNKMLKETTSKYFDYTGSTGSSGLLRVREKYYVFEENVEDVRFKAISEENISPRWRTTGKSETYMTKAEKLIPVMRLPEIYYIAAEAGFDIDRTRAIELFNTVIEEREVEGYEADENISKEDFMKAIVNEYRKEFLGEGLMVFVHKRLNIPYVVNEGIEPLNGKYVFPIPDSNNSLEN